ncbi:ABC transporter transmembrane domain-containing protein [Engelhardtia mirabilis]|uniref:Multidrug export ATP-binding/permease protein n=1 Tax=Engelhardtia mirabilis TaxID=2528011 RepID=A0A518BDI9_9BACT|nr:Putative multidrug export ATP-binding/permease protein [Planctomycetes bacterium Pla133]QDU99348.1 Putative multidrug export ATP-binding/permease protein [Planctomycetes bacterium Pla86]
MRAPQSDTSPEDPPLVEFRRLFGLARPHLRPLIGATALMLVASGIGLIVPMFAGGVVDTALSDSTSAELRSVVAGLLGLFALLGVVGFFESYLLGATGARLLRDLRWQLFDRLVDLTPGFYDKRRVGELLSRLGSDLALVQGALTQQIPSGLQASMRFIGTLVILFVLQTRLTLVALVVVPPVVLVAIYFGNKLQKIATKERDAAADSSALAEEALAGIRTVQSHAAEPRVRGRYSDQLAALLGIQLRNAWLNAGFAGTVTFASFSAFGLVLGYGGQLMLEGRLTAGELTSFLLYTFSVAISVGQLGGLYAGYRGLKGASARLFELLDTEPAVADPALATPPAPPFEVGAGAIALNEVRFQYESATTPALDGVTLDVPGGAVIALVGPSGSGKSTLFSLLLRFYDPTSGTIAIDGRAIDTIPLADLRRSIAVVPQEVFLFSGTIADNLRLGSNEASDEDLRTAAEAAGALGFIDELDKSFETEVGERGVRLSAGQRQRLAIARAFLQDPKILLLDEATSSLDPDSEAVVQAALQRLFVGRTTLVIAHRLATARRADVIHVLDGGHIAASGTHEELYESSELYRRYWTLQSLELEQAPAQRDQLPSEGSAPAGGADPTAAARAHSPYSGFKFRIVWDGKYVAGVDKISGLTRTYRGSVDHEDDVVRQSPGEVEFGPITLERGVTHDADFEAWANKVWSVGNGAIQEGSLKDFRKDVLIELYNEAGQKVLAYKVYRCWASGFTASPELGASAKTVAIQSLKLENEGWERDTEITEPDEPSF